MPIYEYYCAANNRIYQFYAKTLAQGRTVPKCPDNPRLPLVKVVSAFAVTGRAREPAAAGPGPGGNAAGDAVADARMEAAMGEMEREFSGLDENDPRAMGRMMRKMSELTGEKIDGEMEEVVRKLEEGTDPESLEDQFGGGDDEGGPEGPLGEGPGAALSAAAGQAEKRVRARFRRGPPVRDPKLYDYE